MPVIRREDFAAQSGRAEGGDFLRITHTPTGVSRRKGPPLSAPGKAREEMMREIAIELVAQGWSYPSKREDA